MLHTFHLQVPAAGGQPDDAGGGSEPQALGGQAAGRRLRSQGGQSPIFHGLNFDVHLSMTVTQLLDAGFDSEVGSRQLPAALISMCICQ